MKYELFQITESIGHAHEADSIGADCGKWSGSTLFVTHPAILESSTGSKIDLFRFED